MAAAATTTSMTLSLSSAPGRKFSQCGRCLARMAWSMMILSGHGLSKSAAATPRVHRPAIASRHLMRRRCAQKICRNRLRSSRLIFIASSNFARTVASRNIFDRKRGQFLQQRNRLALPRNFAVLLPGRVRKQKADFAHQRELFVPGHAPGQIRIRAGGALISFEDTATQRGKVGQLVRLAQREAAQLREQIAKIKGRVAACTVVKIQHNHPTVLPEKLRRAEIAVQERWRRRDVRRVLTKLPQSVRQTVRLSCTETEQG